MSTFTSKDIIATMLQNDGVYPGDPQCTSIYEYTNDWGHTAWAAFWPGVYNDIYESPFCHDVKLLWDNVNGLTLEGREYLK